MEAAEIPFAIVRKFEGRGRSARSQLASSKILEDLVRSVRGQAKAGSASHQWGSDGQHGGQYTDAVCTLPCQAASWEDGISRIATKVPARVDRLRSLGNAVVPQVAEFVGRIIVGMVVVILLPACLGGCHLHVGEIHRHVHRATNEPAKAADVIDDILERLDDANANLEHENVSVGGGRDAGDAGR